MPSLGKVFGGESSFWSSLFYLDRLGERFSLWIMRNIYIVNRCCMCKNIWESVGHLLLCCSYAYNLWTFVFSLFGVSWVMPKQVVDLLACWNRGVGGRCLGSNSTMHHVTISWEHNLRTFNGEEHSIIELNGFSCLLYLIGWLHWAVLISPLFENF